jgi:hypothetical protein
MSLSLSKLTVSGTAAAGTVVGVLSMLNASAAVMQANFILGKGSAGFFAISGNNLVTVNPSLSAGNYSVFVRGVGTKTYWSDEGYFNILITPT